MSQGNQDGQGDTPSATPLDLLINAIAGSTATDHPYAPTPTYHVDSNVTTTTERAGQEEHSHGGALATGSRASTAEGNSTSLNDGVDGGMNIDGLLNPSRRSDDTELDHIGHPHKRPKIDRSPSPRQKKIAKTLSAHIIQDSHPTTAPDGAVRPSVTSENDVQGMISMVEVWHPTTGQKSYGKERRILAPPPILRVTGPLLPAISSLTLHTSTIPSTSSASQSVTSGSQTHRIISNYDSPLPEALGSGKRAERQDRKRRLREAARIAGFGATLPKARSNVDGKFRDVLLDGLGFPGLWIGEEVGKAKEFRLELRVGLESDANELRVRQQAALDPQFSADEDRTQAPEGSPNESSKIEHAAESRAGPFDSIGSATDLDHSLDLTAMEVLRPLAEAVRQAGTNDEQILPNRFTEPLDESNILNEPTLSSTADRPVSATPNDASKPWATFISSALRIVSKPSQKTAKARSMASCFSSDSSFALWTRIHGQTVRTKYMKLEVDDEGGEPSGVGRARLTSKTGKWTPFKFLVIRRAAPPPQAGKKQGRSSNHTEAEQGDKLTYGSIVVLVDLQSGTKSDPVKIVKVEAGQVRVGEDEGHPISELQRIGLVRLKGDDEDTTEGVRWYLSAPGARLGGAEVVTNASNGRIRPKGKAAPPVQPSPPDSPTVPAPNPDLAAPISQPDTLNSLEPVGDAPADIGADGDVTMAQDVATPAADTTVAEPSAKGKPKKVKTKRHALAAAVLAEDEDGGAQSVLTWARAGREEQGIPMAVSAAEGGCRSVIVEKVEDWMSWTIGGVSCFSYSFFSTSETTSPLLASTIDPIPRMLIPPTLYPELNTLQLHLSEFFFPSSSNAVSPLEPLDVYVGPIGPLYCTTWRSTAPSNVPTAAIPYNLDSNPGSQNEHAPEDRDKVMSSFPADQRHVIVVVHMPNTAEIFDTLQSLRLQSGPAVSVSANRAENDAPVQVGAGGVHGQSSPTDPMNRPMSQDGATRGGVVPSEDSTTWSSDQLGPASATFDDASVDPSAPETQRDIVPPLVGEAHGAGREEPTPDELSIAAALEMASHGFGNLEHLVPFDSELVTGTGHGHEHGYQIDAAGSGAELAEGVKSDMAVIDPDLRGLGPDIPRDVSAHHSYPDGRDGKDGPGTTADGSTGSALEPITLHVPPSGDAARGMQMDAEIGEMRLPIYLVRRDGTVFKLGKNVSMVKLGGGVSHGPDQTDYGHAPGTVAYSAAGERLEIDPSLAGEGGSTGGGVGPEVRREVGDWGLKVVDDRD